MDDFLEINQDWFFKSYGTLLSRRYWSFKIALNLFLQLDGQNLVETGCIRKEDDWEGGMSTLIFAHFACKYERRFWTIDISHENLALARKICGKWAEGVGFIEGDSVQVLKEWKEPIDLLYLDSLDCDPASLENTLKAQEHQLKEVKVAYPNLTKNAVVLLDDNYFVNGGKTKLSKTFLKNKGWVNLMDFESSLWVRRG